MKILFFTPHVALWEHTVPEAYLARGLAECGHEVQYLNCGRAQNYCVCMSAWRLSSNSTLTEREPVCRSCQSGAKALRQAYGFATHSLADYLEPGDREECAGIARSAVETRSLETNFLGVEIGKTSLYEFTLKYKKMSTNLTDEQWLSYGVYLENALISLRTFARHLERDCPEAIVTFSPQYSIINSCMHFAMNMGVRVLFMESGTNISHRLGTMRVWDWKIHKLVNPALKYWGTSCNNPVTLKSARAVTGHFRQLLSGKHCVVFSEPYKGTSGMRGKWPIRPDQQIALLTLSSYDEAYAALLIDAFPHDKVFSSVFRTQAEWVKATIDWARTRPDVFLVIRVHPRDFPNKREQMRSEQSYMFEGLFEDVPDNVHVNWPSEGVSLYELFEDVDVVLTGWSVTAMEGLILGIPVVTYDEKLPSYPPDIMLTGRSEDKYFDNIDRALRQGWSVNNVTNGFRWLAYNFVSCTVPVSLSYGRHELADRTFRDRGWKFVKNALFRIGKLIDLLGWRQAMEGSRLVDLMLCQGFDAIPPARVVAHGDEAPADDADIIAAELKALHDLLYANSKLPPDKAGLSKNICTYLENRSNS